MKSILTEKWLVCRICLKQPKDAMQSIFSSNTEKDLTRMILECGGVPIKRFDHYPDKICSVCYGHLQVAQKFRTTCQRSHNQLSRFIAPVVIEKNEYVIGFEETVDTDFALTTDHSSNTSNTTLVATDETKDECLERNENTNNSLTSEEYTIQEVAETEYYDDLVEFYEPAPEEVIESVDPNCEEKEIVTVFQELDQGEVEYLEMENEPENEHENDLHHHHHHHHQDQENKHENDNDDYHHENDNDNDHENDNDIGNGNGNEVEMTTSDEDYKPPQSLEIREKKRPRGRPPKRGTSTTKGSTSGSENRSKRSTTTIKSEGGGVVRKSKVVSYICDFCGNKYPTQGRLTEHIKLHKGIKPHECEICGHAFAQTQQLARHMNTHTGNRPYKCNYCPAAFADLSTRNKHHRIHTNERPYVCDVCGKTFTYTNTLKFHKMIHTGEKPFVCDECGKGFQQAYKLRSHKQIHQKHKYVKTEAVQQHINAIQQNTNVTISATKTEMTDDNY